MGRDSATYHWSLCPFCILQFLFVANRNPSVQPKCPPPPSAVLQKESASCVGRENKKHHRAKRSSSRVPFPCSIPRAGQLRWPAHDSLLQDRRANTVSRSEQKWWYLHMQWLHWSKNKSQCSEMCSPSHAAELDQGLFPLPFSAHWQLLLAQLFSEPVMGFVKCCWQSYFLPENVFLLPNNCSSITGVLRAFWQSAQRWAIAASEKKQD